LGSKRITTNPRARNTVTSVSMAMTTRIVVEM